MNEAQLEECRISNPIPNLNLKKLVNLASPAQIIARNSLLIFILPCVLNIISKNLSRLEKKIKKVCLNPTQDVLFTFLQVASRQKIYQDIVQLNC